MLRSIQVLGYSAIVLALVAGGEARAVQVLGTQATLSWSPASGPVAGYAVFESRNGGAFPSAPSRTVATTSDVVRGAAGDTVVIRVAAMDAQGNRGPLSPVSETVSFAAPPPPSPPPPPPGDGGGSPPPPPTGDGGGSLPPPSTPPGDGGGGAPAAGTGSTAGDPLAGLDLDGNGSSDLIFFAPKTGAVFAWLMDGSERMQGMLLATQTDPELDPAAVADFDGDGQADILWHAPGAGQTELWLLRGTSIVRRSLPTQPTGSSVGGSADFDGDGITDIFWTSAGGDNELWYMNTGAGVDQRAPLPPGPLGYDLAGIGDFDGDTLPDLLWQNGGRLEWWKMQGAVPTAVVNLPPVLPGDVVARVADLDGDGLDDLVWSAQRRSRKRRHSRRRTTHYITVWYMNGMAAPDAAVAVATSTPYAVAGLADLDADGQVDVAVRNATGETLGAEIDRTRVVLKTRKKRKRRRRRIIRWDTEWNATDGTSLGEWRLLTP